MWRLDPFGMIIWLSLKWPSVAVIAAVYTIVMASMYIEAAAMSMQWSGCQHNGSERK